MDRRFGAESILGIGGGTVSPESRKNLETAEDFCRKKKPRKALPFLLQEVDKDPNNLDAVVQLASLMLTMPDVVSTLEDGELRGRAFLRKRLGHDCFQDSSEYPWYKCVSKISNM